MLGVCILKSIDDFEKKNNKEPENLKRKNTCKIKKTFRALLKDFFVTLFT